MMDWHRIPAKGWLGLVLVLATFMAFWKLGAHPVYEWDESRQGVNAFEMLNNGDYLNLYYGGEPDTWNAKPPLMVWLIAGSYALFGFNEFALRLPAALSIIAFFFFVFQLIKDARGPTYAGVTCLILMAGSAIFTRHIGRSGDFDALLLCFTMAFAWQFFRYLKHRKTSHALWAGLFLGLAFFTKAFAAFFLLPGLLVFLILQGSFWGLLKQRATWLCVLAFLVFAGGWIALSAAYGLEGTDPTKGQDTAIKTMILNDVFARFFDDSFHQATEREYGFVFSTLDIHFNLWNYLFYLVMLVGGFAAIRQIKRWREIAKEQPLLVFSICQFFVLGGLLSFSATPFYWYLAAIFPFVAFIITSGIGWAVRKKRWLAIIPVGLFLFTFGRQVVRISESPEGFNHLVSSHQEAISEATVIYLHEVENQDMRLYLQWLNPKLKFVREWPTLQSGDLVLTRCNSCAGPAKHLDTFEDVHLYRAEAVE